MAEEKLAVYSPDVALIRQIDDLVPKRPVDNLDELAAVLERLRAKDLAFVLAPMARVDHVQAFHQISLRAVWIDPTVTHVKTDRGGFWKAGPHCYRASFTGADEVALSKNGLAAIIGAAGDTPRSRRVDDGSIPYFAQYEAMVYHREYDGAVRGYPASKTVDLRDGSPTAKAMTPKQLETARQFVAENAESKAILRAVRPLYGMAQSYPIADLRRKPFVVPKLVRHWDLSDPDQKRAAIAEAVNSESRLFGGSPMVTVPELPPAEVTSAPALPAAPTATTAADASAPAIDEPATTNGGDDIADLPDAFDKPTLVVCTCPCGHEKEITPATAEATKTRTGGVARCSACYPGKSFDYESHKTLTRLGMPRFEALTADEIRAYWTAEKKDGKK